MRSLPAIALLTLVLCCTACGSSSGGGSNNTTNTGTNNQTSSGTNNGGTNNTGATVSFQNDLAPYMIATCGAVGCHATPALESFNIDNGTMATPQDLKKALDGVMAQTSQNLLVNPGHKESSEIYVRITVAMGAKRMPFGGQPLPADKVKMIGDWIDQGANYSN